MKQKKRRKENFAEHKSIICYLFNYLIADRFHIRVSAYFEIYDGYTGFKIIFTNYIYIYYKITLSILIVLMVCLCRFKNILIFCSQPIS